MESPDNFSFFQAVRLLERTAVYQSTTDKLENSPQKNPPTRHTQNPIARFTPPETEIIRFQSHQALRFPATEIVSLDRRKNRSGEQQWRILIDFLGLTGAMGVMPYHYTEFLLQRLRLKDPSMAAFFDLFNHRTISLFYQAGTKYSLPIEYERKKLFPTPSNPTDTATHSLLSLIGLGTDHITAAMHNPRESFLYYSGLLSQQIRTASGLENMLRHHFNIPVQIREMVGQWQDLIDDVRTSLPTKARSLGQNARLGRSVIVGRRSSGLV